jgi:hypothetical protein
MFQRQLKGYQEILRARDATAAAAMLPENRAAAVLARAAQICHELQQKIDSEMRSRSERVFAASISVLAAFLLLGAPGR